MLNKKPSHPLIALFTNHLDAWGLTFVILTLFFMIHEAFTRQNILLMVAITMMYWLGFAVNDFYDAPFDALTDNKARRNAFVQDKSLKRTFILVMISVSVFAFWGFANFGFQGIVIFAFSVLILWAYSAPPIRLKSRPVVDVMTHILFVETYPYVLCLVLIAQKLTATDFYVLAFFALASLGAQLEQQIRDIDIDSQVEQTFTTTFGIHRSHRLLLTSTFFLLAVGLIGLFTGNLPLWMLPFLVVGTPSVLHRFFRPIDAPRPEKLIRLTAVLVLIYACLLWFFYRGM